MHIIKIIMKIGAFVEITMGMIYNSDFSFKTSCMNMEVVCAVGKANCFNLTAVVSSACTIS